MEPTMYELSCDGTTLTYSTSGIDGTSQLSYATGDRSYVFRGDEIRLAETEIGRTVTVTLEAVPDLHVETLTLLLPPTNLQNGESRLRTEAITTTHRTSIGGPRLVRGQVLSYATATLSGMARSVVF
jgi:hypothetical protein